MSSIFDPPTQPQAQPWPVPALPRPPAPGGYGTGPRRRSRAAHRVRTVVLIALGILMASLAAFYGQRSPAGTSAGATLTTAQIVRQTAPGLVDIVSTNGYQNASAAGTGLVLTPSGEVLTNNHVIEGATAIRVTDVGNGRTYRAAVVGYDRSRDIAVLRLRAASGLTTVALGNSSGAQVGQQVVALGNAGGQGGTPSVVTGQITGLRASVTASDAAAGTAERLTGLLRHNAAIAPGDSGGPLVTKAGKVIGINTAASVGFNLGPQQGKTRAFAVPVNMALAIARQIEAGRASATVHIGATGFLGVQVTSQAAAVASGIPAGAGAVMTGVVPDSPAQRAGLAAGDIIVSVGNHRVSSPSALQSALGRHHPGDSVRIGWTDQGGQTRSAILVLDTGPAA